MNLTYFIERLDKNRFVFEALVRSVGPEQVRWKPEPDKWSILEVVNHLFDEEREDFRQRLRLSLSDRTTEWPKIDPQGWVVSRGYNQRDLDASLDGFLDERKASLAWLRTLSSPAWDNRHERPTGSLSAGDLLASWLAHDFLHIRQLTRLHWQLTGAVSAPYQTTYAGPWKEA